MDEVQLLGGVAVRVDGALVRLPGEKQRRLMACLALALPESVSDTRLIDRLWGDDLPRNPANALQALVSQLRRIVGPLIVRAPGGYLLAAERDAVDALRLERLVRAGRAAAADGDGSASDRFAEAVELVAGRSIDDLAEDVPLDVAVWMENLVLGAHEGWIDAALAGGRHGDVVEQLQALVGQHPLRERFHTQLITALYRCGRQSEALAAYGHVRTVLADELGLDPGPELQALERAVLEHDPRLAAPAQPRSKPPPPELPAALTSFVGRVGDIARVFAALGGARLVTVAGPAGIGKSRLVLEVAHHLRHERAVWYVELAPVTDGVAVPETVAAAVGAQRDRSVGDDGRALPPDQRTIERLRGRAALLILDNCEHLADAAAACVRTLLAACPDLRVVVTSQQALGIGGEQRIVLDPLDGEDALRLFVDRARAIQPLLSVAEDEAEIRDICRQLDGLPLAIELAAARTRVLSVPEIGSRLERRFELLRSTDRDIAPRHRALAVAIDASYDMLFDEERRAFRTLAVFAGGMTMAAAQHVLGPDALDILSRLVDRSMVVAETTGRAARFRLLESLRHYGIDRLHETGEHADAVARWIEWCVELAEAAERGLHGRDQLEWLDRVDAEHDNLRAALVHLSVTDPVSGLRLIGALFLPWWARSHRDEARHWAEVFLAAADDAPPEVLAMALAGAGWVSESGGWTGVARQLEDELALAEARQRRAIDLSREAGAELVLARCQTMLVSTLIRSAAVRTSASDDDVARLVDEAAAIFERAGDWHHAGMVRTLETMWHLVHGQVDAAASSTDDVRRLATLSGDRWSTANSEWLTGMQDEIEGDLHGAYRRTERSLRLFDELGFGHVVTGQAEMLARLSDRAGLHGRAEDWRMFNQQRTVRAKLHEYDGTVLAAISTQVGLDARRAGQLEQAERAHSEALAWYAQVGVTASSAFTYSCLGFLAAERGDQESALARHRQALDAAAAVADVPAIALGLEGVASCTTDLQRAAELLGAAWAMYSAVGTSPATHRDDAAAVERRARAALGDAAFELGLERGAARSRAETLKLARRA